MQEVHDEADTATPGPEATGTRRRTPIYVLSSARARVGKTLIARLLTEFFIASGRPVAAFDVNPGAAVLADYLPAYTSLVSLADTRGQVTLFDQLIAPDAVTKIVDLAPTSLDTFVDLMTHIGFLEEARRSGIDPVILFVTEPHKLSLRAYGALQHRCPELALVPVHNDAVTKGYSFDFKPVASQVKTPPLHIPMLSPAINAIIDRSTFSFNQFLAQPAGTATELHSWINRIFLEFRELELRLMLRGLHASLQIPR